jgi:phosphopantetheinyl transferase (holo-ACP synthase)
LGVDGLGRPRLLGQGARSPVISFSEGGGRLWCALFGDDDYQIGIDVAGASEFPEKYPFHRVFQVEEMRQALRLTGGEEARAAALLWSVKEAAVKAVGCAFHFAGPGEITAYPLPVEAKGEGWRPFEVRLSASALPSFSAPLRQTIRVHSLPQEKLWLSVALLNRRAPAYE